jgi:hypothetical protein
MNELRSIQLNAEDYDLVHGDDVHDTPFQDRQAMVLVYGTSPELVFGGSRYVEGASIGSYVVPQGDQRVSMRSVLFQPIVFTLTHPEFTVGDGDDRGAFVCDHGVKPPGDTDFLKASGDVSRKIGPYPAGLVGKTGFYRINDRKPGNRVVPTITAFGLVNGFAASFAMYGTAWKVGRDFASRAARLTVKVDPPLMVNEKDNALIDVSELHGPTLGVFTLTSRMEKGAYEYPVPVISAARKLGEDGGPTLAQWRLAQGLRRRFQRSGMMDWTPLEAIEVPAPPPEPGDRALPNPRAEIQRPRPDIRSGRGAWDHGQDPAPPHPGYDAPDDPIPF